MNYTDVINFWFAETEAKNWFMGGEEFDEVIKERFVDVHEAVRQNECDGWRATPEGSLAEVIVLDQFSRNMFRGSAEAFTYDGQALALAQVAVAKDFHSKLTPVQRQFLYMPYMHSESKHVHETALQLFTELGNEENLTYEKIHKEIVDRFGRYPHRNQQLGRTSTPEEVAYLESEQEAFFNS